MKLMKIMLLFIFFIVSGCTSNNVYSTETVSTEDKGYYTRNVNNQSEDILKSNIMIHNNNYSSFLGVKYKKNNTYGSGFVYDSDENYYYVLTNNHVVAFDYSYNHNELIVEDYFGNKYVAEVVGKDINYDLAVIRFERKVELETLSISEDVISVRDSVKSMGNPDSNKNVISEGMISCFSNIYLDTNKAKVDFEVIVHSARIKGGSSGSALLNNENEVIGITFAGVFDNNGEFITGYAIPVNKINEFLSKYI